MAIDMRIRLAPLVWASAIVGACADRTLASTDLVTGIYRVRVEVLDNTCGIAEEYVDIGQMSLSFFEDEKLLSLWAAIRWDQGPGFQAPFIGLSRLELERENDEGFEFAAHEVFDPCGTVAARDSFAEVLPGGVVELSVMEIWEPDREGCANPTSTVFRSCQLEHVYDYVLEEACEWPCWMRNTPGYPSEPRLECVCDRP
jgi:hypothetical protein